LVWLVKLLIEYWWVVLGFFLWVLFKRNKV